MMWLGGGSPPEQDVASVPQIAVDAATGGIMDDANILNWIIGTPLAVSALLLVIWMLTRKKASANGTSNGGSRECKTDSEFKSSVYEQGRVIEAMAEVVLAKDSNQAPKLLKASEYMARIDSHMAEQTDHMKKQTEFMGIIARNVGTRAMDVDDTTPGV